MNNGPDDHSADQNNNFLSCKFYCRALVHNKEIDIVDEIQQRSYIYDRDWN
jgi:hypothetical protein